MKKTLFAILFFAFLSTPQIFAQFIVVGQDTLYGNEWINYNQTYFKIKVGQDGIYRVTSQSLENAGVPLSQVNGEQFQLWHNGQQTPIYTTTNSTFSASDFIEFFGEKNTSELDRFLFRNPDSMMMNPLYSLVTDTSAYFLTWVSNGGNLRFQNTANDLTNLPAKEDYYMAKFISNSVNNVRKKADSQGISTSDYSMAEGYATDFANVKTYTLNPTAIYFGNVTANLEFRFSGNNGQHQQVIQLNDQPIFTAQYYDYEVQKPVIDLTNAQLTTTMNVKVQGLQSNSDNHRMANIILTYPRSFDFENKQSFAFDIPASNTVKYLEISNFNSNNGQPVLYDLTNHLRIVGANEGGLIKIALPPSQVGSKLILVNDNSGQVSVATLKPVSFINYQSMSNDYIIVTGKTLLDDGAGTNRVQEYADYRASMDGGSFTPIIVEVEQLYEQFSWGIERHPFAVRNFALYIKKNWANPKYFFIIGKGREYPSYRTAAGLQSALNFGFYVPTYSFPGSDNLLLAGTDGFTPVIPIGRLAALKPGEVSTYLDKVKEFEANRNLPQTIEDRLWMKKVLHMGGGLTNAEQSSIKSYLAQMENIIENSSFGGEVKSFFKTSSDPIQVSQTEQIFDFINKGTSIITFFGHSAIGAFDFSIDNPDNFQNKGKYPLLFSLGCYSGNIHSGSQGIAEQFLFYKDKGAIVFGATSGQGFGSALYTFSSKLYQNIGLDMYGNSIGEAIQNTIYSLPSNGFGVNLIRQQFNLHGDPALRVNPAPGPDYVVDASSVSFSPTQLTTQLKSFEFSCDMVNLGKYIHDSIRVSIIQEIPDGSKIELINELITAPSFSKNLTFELPSLGKEALGLNRFYVKVDVDNRVGELPSPNAENNNQLLVNGQLGIGIYITDNSVQAVYPPEFGIVTSPNIELKATTANLLSPAHNYVIQIDTSELFNSPILLTSQKTQLGGIFRWSPPTNYWKDNQVYYWRVSPDSISQNESYLWSNSSFIYLENSEKGWNQSHFYQWKKNEFVNMELPSHGDLKFLDNFKDVFIRTAVNSVELTRFYVNNGFAGRYWYAPDAGIYVTVFDSTTVKNWTNAGPPYLYGLPQPNGYWVASFLFETITQGGRQQLIDFLENVVPDKNYVFLFTVQANLNSDYKPQDWESDQQILGTDLFQVLEKQGANIIRNTLTTGSLPYVFAYKKGVAPITEAIADSLTDILEVNFSMPGYWDRGNMNSTAIGPARQWKTLQWEAFSKSHPTADTISIDLFATDPVLQKDTLLISNIQPGETDLSFLEAAQFPFLKLSFNSEDSLYRTSAQLKYWRLLFDGVPDFAIDPASYYSFQSDSLPQGKPLKMEYLVENMADFPGDTLLIRYTLRNSANEESYTFDRVKPLQGNDTLVASLLLDTRYLQGLNRLSVELNPNDEQKELTRSNNVLNTGFFVETDKRNPLLEVTFDGQYILDGDLVSAKPIIRIELNDENQYLSLNDTSLIRLFLVYPDSAEQLYRVYFNDPMLEFFPATANAENRASVEISPSFLKDGTYQLLVQAQDVTGNASGQFDYKVAFKVITKSMISNVLNYPNPFTTSTRFVYTLTGSEPPERFKLQIMTVSGRVVRELTQDELGMLKVGTHQTDYAWDGTDEFGDPLAKGVYLYRVLVQDGNGKEWDKYETGADAFVKNGYGKMVLLR